MRSHDLGDEERRRSSDRASVVLPDKDSHGLGRTGLMDAPAVARLPGAQLRGLAAELQRTLGNHGTAEVLASVQRAPVGPAVEQASGSSDLTITTLTARVNEKPSFIAHPVAELSRGDRVRASGDRRGGWQRVTVADGHSGWLHQSAWQTSKPSLSSAPGGPGGTTPEDEVEIGGRG